MLECQMGLDERVFRAHVQAGPFLSGVDRGRWRLLSIAWPLVLIAVTAAAREQGPAEYVFRFHLADYPQTAPTAQPWDVESDIPLRPERWPAGHRRVPQAFRTDWQGGTALYLPCDRISVQGHDAWRTQHPHLLWKPTGDVTQYLEIIHELLNSSDYSGARGA
jgi:hypothetical protein